MSLYGSIVVKQHILPQLLFNLDETPMTFTDQYKYSEIMMEDGQLPAAVIPERMANVTILLTNYPCSWNKTTYSYLMAG